MATAFLRGVSSQQQHYSPNTSNESVNTNTDAHSLRYSSLDHIPDFLYALKNLVTLNLSHNALKELPKPFFNSMKNLRVLYLTSNELSSLSDFSRLSKLQTLCFSNNQLSNQAVDHAHLDRLHHLTNLYLAQNDLGMDVPETIGRCGKLTTLSLTKNRIQDVDRLSKLTSLEWLGLSDNELTGLPSSLGMLRKLEGITLSGNPMDTGSVATNINLNLTVVVAKPSGHEEGEAKSNADLSFAPQTARDSSPFIALFPDVARNSPSATHYPTYTLTRSHKGPESYLSLSSALMAVRSAEHSFSSPSSSKSDESGESGLAWDGDLRPKSKLPLSPITETLLPFSDNNLASASSPKQTSPDTMKLHDEIREVLRKMNEGETILTPAKDEEDNSRENDEGQRVEEKRVLRPSRLSPGDNRPRLRNAWIQIPGRSLSPILASPISATAPELLALPESALPLHPEFTPSEEEELPGLPDVSESVPLDREEQESPTSGLPSPVIIVSGMNLGCWKCNKAIEENEEAVGAVEKTWHRSCFSCNSCGTMLVERFYEHNGQPYCQTDYDMLQMMFGEEEEEEEVEREVEREIEEKVEREEEEGEEERERRRRE